MIPMLVFEEISGSSCSRMPDTAAVFRSDIVRPWIYISGNRPEGNGSQSGKSHPFTGNSVFTFGLLDLFQGGSQHTGVYRMRADVCSHSDFTAS